MPYVQRDAALAGVLVVELSALVDVGHAGERPRRLVARLAAADRRHRGKPRIRMRLQLDLDALGAERGEKPRAARGREKPREVDDPDTVERERLAALRRRLFRIDFRTRADHGRLRLEPGLDSV